MSRKFQVEIKMNYILVTVSVFYPFWNRPREQVACQKPVQLATQLRIS
jgi:hypothetical protein